MTAMPFTVDRASGIALAAQIVHGIEGACSAGVYAPGDRLPGIRELAVLLDVSEIVVRQAMRTLAERGVVVSQRRTGIHIGDRTRRTWRAHVVLIHLSDTPYFVAVNRSLQLILDRANVRLTTQRLAGLDHPEDLLRLRTLFDSQRTDLVALSGWATAIAAEIDRRGLPHVAIGRSSPSAHARGWLGIDQQSAWHELAEHLRTRGVRRVARIPAVRHHEPAAMIDGVFAAAGLRLVPVMAEAITGEGFGASERCGLAEVRTLLARRSLPDALVFSDDWVARGGLLALAEAGVRYPSDLRVATHANRGFAPVGTCELTRVEADPEQHAADQAALILQGLDLANTPAPAVMGMRFIPGAST
jgi:LacI family transcriptional regulator